MLNIKPILLALLSAPVSLAALADRPWPDKVYDCHVLTHSGAHGVVSIQTYSMADAEEGVLGLPAVTQLGVEDVASGVVQCVEKGSGRSFTDAGFQEWLSQTVQ